jgi:two-component system LytT family response regulator
MTVRTYLLDGHGLREELRDMPSPSWLELVGEEKDGTKAGPEIERLEPDLLFVDLNLPGLDALEFVRGLRSRPHVVFVADGAEAATTAFEIEALDYLTRPLARPRLRETLERARRRAHTEAVRAGRPRRFFVQREGRLIPIQPDEISRVEACGDYVYIHCSGQAHLVHLNLRQMRTRLRPDQFLQIHRSHIVNLDHVQALRSHDDRRFSVALRDGTEIVASRAGTVQLRTLIA